MKLSKKNIISLFEDSKSKNFTIKNVVIFDKDIVIDISITNPTLQARKKVESSIKVLITQKFGDKINIQINTIIEKPVNNTNQIKTYPEIVNSLKKITDKNRTTKAAMRINQASLINIDAVFP